MGALGEVSTGDTLRDGADDVEITGYHLEENDHDKGTRSAGGHEPAIVTTQSFTSVTAASSGRSMPPDAAALA